MYKYFFILGNNHRLSIAEIYSVLNGWNYSFETISEREDYLLLNCSTPLNLAELQKQLGGTIKTGEIFHESPNKNLNTFGKALEKYVIEKSFEHKKLFFGLNLYESKRSNLKHQLFKWALTLKKEAKSLDYGKIRLVNSKDDILSSVVVKKNKLLEEFGFDINIFIEKKNIYIGRTLNIQDFEFYNEIDYGRPASDAKSGMLPPKLAQTMINLAENPKNPKDLVFLDPFCGSGTILMQAVLQGFIHINGSDISEKAVYDTVQNLAYISKITSIDNFKSNIQEIDVNNLSTAITKESIDLVSTETFLGPALKGTESKEELIANRNELIKLYEITFDEIYKVLKPGGKFIITIPIFIYKNDFIDFDIQRIIQNNFKSIKTLKDYGSLYTKRKSLVYKREGQKLWREIFCFEKE